MNINACTQKLNAMVRLEDGWDSYGAKKPGLLSRMNALFFCEIACAEGPEPGSVSPTPMGGVGVEFEAGDRNVLIEFYNKGTAHSIFYDDRTDEDETKPVGTDNDSYRAILSDIRTYLEQK
jgi:hypothetical protein